MKFERVLIYIIALRCYIKGNWRVIIGYDPLYHEVVHVNGVNCLATKGYKILLTTEKTRKRLPTSDKKINWDLPTTDKG